MGTKELKYCMVRKNIFCNGPTREAKGEQKSLVPARQAQGTGQERTPFICPLWVPIRLSFNSKQGPPLSTYGLSDLTHVLSGSVHILRSFNAILPPLTLYTLSSTNLGSIACAVSCKYCYAIHFGKKLAKERACCLSPNTSECNSTVGRVYSGQRWPPKSMLASVKCFRVYIAWLKWNMS